MNRRFQAVGGSRIDRTWQGRALVACSLIAVITACGGGGGATPDPGPSIAPVINTSVVSLAGTANIQAQYGRPVMLTLSGVGLDADRIAVSNSACSGLVRSTTEPYASTSTNAWYQCTVDQTGVGRFDVRRVADGMLLRSSSYTVADPQVRLVFNNDPAFFLQITLDVRAPATVQNFLDYVNAGFYNGTVMHRLQPGVLLEGGLYAAPVSASTSPVAKPARAPIALESVPGLTNGIGAIAMTRTGGAGAGATSGFLLNLGNNAAGFDGTLPVFGSVSAGASLLASSGALGGAACTAATWLPADGSCLPSPALVLTSATQTR